MATDHEMRMEALRLYEENGRLKTTLRMVLENQGGHQHWDSFGTGGANCPICERQQEAARQAWGVLRACEVNEQFPAGNSVIPCPNPKGCNWPACPQDCQWRPGR